VIKSPFRCPVGSFFFQVPLAFISIAIGNQAVITCDCPGKGREMGTIAENLARVEERIEAAAARAGRSREEILLVAVTKTVDPARVNEAIDAGVKAIGENRVQEARGKWPDLKPGPERHLIGRLQRNKAGRAVELFDLIESVDRAPLADAISRRAESAGKVVPVLLEVNVSGEASKAGAAPDQVRGLLEEVAPLPGIRVKGLMTIGPMTRDEPTIRRAFQSLRGIAENLAGAGISGVEMKWLSMGMSGDFEIAVEEGAHIVRIGSAIFGDR